jgi:hypothetical protein
MPVVEIFGATVVGILLWAGAKKARNAELGPPFPHEYVVYLTNHDKSLTIESVHYTLHEQESEDKQAEWAILTQHPTFRTKMKSKGINALLFVDKTEDMEMMEIRW